MNPQPPRNLATPLQVATWLQVKPNTLRIWRQRDRGPRYIKLNGQIRYAWPDVHAWAAQHRTNDER